MTVEVTIPEGITAEIHLPWHPDGRAARRRSG